MTDESLPDEPGYSVRQRGANGVRAEGVRLHGAVMLIVRAIRMNVPDTHPGAQVVKCEALVKTLQQYMMSKLGWREEDPR